MCFSASASFTASILLLALSRVAYQKTSNKFQIMFASLPLLFAIQQACEGVLWLSFSYSQLMPLKQSALYMFLFFAFVIWPLWIPVSTWLIERTQPKSNWLVKITEQKSKIFHSLIGFGFLVSTALTAVLIYGQPNATVYQGHINYIFNLPLSLYIIGTIGYLIAVVLPLLASSIPSMQIFGLLIAASYFVSFVFYYMTVTSIWCFFVALLSAGVTIILDQINKK